MKKKNLWIDLLMLALFITGIGALAYPFVSDSVNHFLDQQIINYHQDKANRANQEEMDRIHAEMEEKNKEIAKQRAPGVDPYIDLDEDAPVEQQPLTFYEEHTIGVITIPDINVRLPIYDSTLPVFLEKGSSLLEGTSFPTGGESTHSVITSHAGLTHSKLFTDLEKMEEGDEFYIEINNRTLAYKVDQIKVVLPTEIDDVQIFEGEDYVTLLTCTPYMINTHRLLVRGHRIPYLPTTGGSPMEEVVQAQRLRMIIYGVLILVVSGSVIWMFYRILFNYRISKRTYDLMVPLGEEEGALTLMNAKGTKPVRGENGEVLSIQPKPSGEIKSKNIPGGKYRLMNKDKGIDILLFIKRVKDEQFSLKFN